MNMEIRGHTPEVEEDCSLIGNWIFRLPWEEPRSLSNATATPPPPPQAYKSICTSINYTTEFMTKTRLFMVTFNLGQQFLVCSFPPILRFIHTNILPVWKEVSGRQFISYQFFYFYPCLLNKESDLPVISGLTPDPQRHLHDVIFDIANRWCHFSTDGLQGHLCFVHLWCTDPWLQQGSWWKKK